MRPTMKIRVDVSIDRKLRAMKGALTADTLIPIMEENCQPVADAMRAGAARRSGQLADSVTVGTELSPAQAAAHVPIARHEVFVGPGPLPQAIAEEFGNFRQAARPFIRPGFDSEGQRAADGIARDGLKLIEDAARRG